MKKAYKLLIAGVVCATVAVAVHCTLSVLSANTVEDQIRGRRSDW